VSVCAGPGPGNIVFREVSIGDAAHTIRSEVCPCNWTAGAGGGGCDWLGLPVGVSDWLVRWPGHPGAFQRPRRMSSARGGGRASGSGRGAGQTPSGPGRRQSTISRKDPPAWRTSP
jgi:hypothetical protein